MRTGGGLDTIFCRRQRERRVVPSGMSAFCLPPHRKRSQSPRALWRLSNMRHNFLRCIGLSFVVMLAAALCAPPASAAGEAAAASLGITPGARADAMGRAHVAIVADGTANWWNPAALGMMRDHVFSLMHVQLVPGLADDVYYEYLSYAQHLEGWGGIGAHVLFLSYGESPEIDADGQQVGTFYSYEVSPAVAAGSHLTNDLYGGVSLKFVLVDLASGTQTYEGNGKGDTFAADLGLLYRPSGTPVALGATLQNWGPDLKFLNSGDAQPIGPNLRVGLGLYLYHTDTMGLLASFDYEQLLIRDGIPAIYHWGAEWAYANVLALRAGYIHDPDGEIEAPTFGFGLAYRSLAFEYASVPQAEGLDRVNKFSLNYRF
ncbi:MAG: PorV/PorQ family protein [Candidatus Eisenbacteria bacterium]|nr:PorV/PorQ family protein [Candidatus Eisenbacteria bacterium]